MRGHYCNHTATTDAVEQAAALRKEQAELRLARIMNGAEPSHKNGTAAAAEQVEKAQEISRLAQNATRH